MNVSIIIVNWNTKTLLDDCLASILRETKDISFEIFVVDNGSSDGSAEMVEKKYLPAGAFGSGRWQAGPQVRLIKNVKNLGFAAAVNLALREAKGDYILILNPDTVIKSGAINKALNILRERPEVGIMGPKTYNKDGAVQHTIRRDPTLSAAIITFLKLPHIFPAILADYYQKNFDYDHEKYVEQIQGSFMLVRRELFDQLGNFDENFFLWFEEVDFCRRVRCAGWKILYSPKPEIIHYGGESFSQVGTAKKQAIFFRSMFRLFKKHNLFKIKY